MRYLLLFFWLLVTGTPLLSQTQISLLTDTALTGWHVVVADEGRVPTDRQDLFVWEDSVLHVLSAAEAGTEQPFAALVTDSVYGSYRLHVEYRWGDKKFAPRNEAVRDAGILFHVYNTDIFWPSGLECQIQEGDTGDAWLIGARARSTLNPDAYNFSPSGKPELRAGERYAKFPRSYSWEQAGWNEIEVEVDEATARFYVNGHLVNEITQAERPAADNDKWIALREGQIALQAEGAEIYYRNVWIAQ